MAITPLKMLLFLGGASGAAFGTAYTTGALDPIFAPQSAVISPSPSGQTSTETPAAADKSEPKPAAETSAQKPAQQEAALQPKAAQPEQKASQPAQENAEPTVPTFDVLRAEPDGSVVIAGKAAPGATVEILAGDKVLGKAVATGEGDFAAVLEEPLKPGDYQLSLRATTQTKVVADSKETAVVSIPATKDGEVLAMIEQPGQPSRIITKPTVAPAEQASTETAAKTDQPARATEHTVAKTDAQPAQPATGAPVSVEAVEIEGRKVFVAGAAPAGAPVRVYANDELLGETKATADGRFLLEVERDLPVGDYQVRADALEPDGKKVIARAEVNFSREPGKSIAAVAPEQPATAPSTQQAPSAAPAQQQAAAKDQPAGGQPQQQAAAEQAGQAGEPAPAGGSDASAKLQAVQGGVIIRRGDSLWRISRRVYGRGVRYSTIYLANNTQIRDPNRIYPGQIFRVPETTEQGEKADMKAIGGQAATIK